MNRDFFFVKDMKVEKRIFAKRKRTSRRWDQE
jgi:hypothetical protein